MEVSLTLRPKACEDHSKKLPHWGNVSHLLCLVFRILRPQGLGDPRWAQNNKLVAKQTHAQHGTTRANDRDDAHFQLFLLHYASNMSIAQARNSPCSCSGFDTEKYRNITISWQIDKNNARADSATRARNRDVILFRFHQSR